MNAAPWAAFSVAFTPENALGVLPTRGAASREARFVAFLTPGPLPGRCGEPFGSAVVGALAVRHGVEALAFLFFRHPQADGQIDQLEGNQRNHT